MQPSFYTIYFAAFAFVLGAALGSFLNVCVYRMPRNLSVNEPRRSFCPNCKYQIPWHHNLPLISWLVLRGKCANCGTPIAIRYLGIELLTGLLFLAVWLKTWPQHWALALPYWVLVSLLVVATFIDFEHFIIPDEITWGGALAGLVLSVADPQMHGQESRLLSGLWSLFGAGSGYALLWLVVEMGKKAFGKKAYAIAAPLPFSWTRRPVQTPNGEESDADLTVGDTSWKSRPAPASGRTGDSTPAQQGESWVWSETFSRESDRLVMKCQDVNLDGELVGEATLVFTYQVLTIGERTWKLDQIEGIRGMVSSLVVPREAMGFGDVKFIACIGAFLGWEAVLFTVMAASVAGSIIGLGSILAGRREWSAKIPFGPYLALGALLWMFSGVETIAWYLQFMRGPE